jgi:transcriptional regulator
MYVPKHFEENREEEINRIIKSFPLATIVANTKSGLIANHIPLLLKKPSKGKSVLFGHIAKHNSLHKELRNTDKILVIFKSEDAYISPNWYPSIHKGQEHVPTWNYQAVHVYGDIVFKYDKKFILKTVGELTKFFEGDNNNGEGWKMNTVSSKYMTAMLKEIVGFEISITKILAKSKLSQNREERDSQNVSVKLKDNGFNFLNNSMTKLK